jgi:hypothetical protein
MGSAFTPRIARTFLYFAGLSCFAAEAIAIRNQRSHALTAAGDCIVFVAPVALGVALLWLARRLPARRVTRLVVELMLVGLAVPVVELALTAFAWPPANRQVERFQVAEKLGIPFDHRDPSQVVDELRARGKDAYPVVPRDLLLQASIDQRNASPIYPLSQVSNSEIVECNENGQYLVWPSDEYGFNNPRGLMTSGHADIAAVGSSYTLGHCVQLGRGFVARLRERYPRTLNFGMPGSFVATMFATLREYVQPLHPSLVLWVMYPNAINAHELQNPIVRGYLQPHYSQHLMERRASVDKFLREKMMPLQREADKESAANAANYELGRWRGVLRLPLLREKVLGPLKGLIVQPPPLDRCTDALAIMRVARDTVEGWGGQLVVVLIPFYPEVVANQIGPDRRNEYIVSVLKPLHLHIINPIPYFRGQPDPAMLYGMGVNNHLSDSGHQLLADYIAADLETHYPNIMARAK